MSNTFSFPFQLSRALFLGNGLEMFQASQTPDGGGECIRIISMVPGADPAICHSELIQLAMRFSPGPVELLLVSTCVARVTPWACSARLGRIPGIYIAN
jgi:hypothetical protein